MSKQVNSCRLVVGICVEKIYFLFTVKLTGGYGTDFTGYTTRLLVYSRGGV